MDVAKLFQGIAVIIDDEIGNEDSTIHKIRGAIESKDIPVLTWDKIPQQGIIPALSSASFIILDWDYGNGNLDLEDGERLDAPEALKAEQEAELIDFIRTLLESIFAPIFIFTHQDIDKIKEALISNNLWNSDKPNRIFIKSKNDIEQEGSLFDAIEAWLKEMPSVYVLKEWGKVISENKNAMFLELYSYSPNWVKIVFDMLEHDSIGSHYEFGSFLTRNLNNKVNGYSFDKGIIGNSPDYSDSELRNVIEGERYLKYDSKKQPKQAYTGDLHKINGDYYLNIRARCDLSRAKKNGKYNPCVYYIKGEKLKDKEIRTNDIMLTDKGNLIFDTKNKFSLGEIDKICKSDEELKKLNAHFKRHRNKVFLSKGNFLERNDEVIIGCIAGEQAIKFKLDIYKEPFLFKKDNRIGRILPPYITRIQQKCAQNMIREGVMPIPEELFANCKD